MGILRTGLVLSLLSTFAINVGHADGASTPEKCAADYFSALTSKGMESTAELMHPEALAAFKKMLLPLVSEVVKEPESPESKAIFGGFMQGKAPEELSPKEFYSTFARGLGGAGTGISRVLQNSHVEVLGHIDEAPDWTHVVYRMRSALEGANISKVSVITLRRDGDGWKVWLTGELEGLAKLLKQQKGK
jgi:hypothetical protein